MFISTVAGRIGTVRRASVIEESARERINRRCVVDKAVPWKTFKSIVFLICLIVFIMQCVEFLTDYYKYPTAIVTDITLPKIIKLPAITFCFRNTISYRKFCFYEPDHCEEPRNRTEFCSKHPFHCDEDNSTLKVPMQDEQTGRILQPYLFNDSYNDDENLFYYYNYSSTARTFMEDVENHGLFLKCYSDNLHLYQSRSKAETTEMEFLNDNLFSWIEMSQRHIELFYPIDMPKVFFGLHSPYLPIVFVDLHAIRPGKIYITDVQLEKEEHLLPPPYQTNCRDNRPSEDAKESTSPNSFQMCLDMCESEFSKAVKGCEFGIKMFSSPGDRCYGDDERPDLSNEEREEARKKHFICIQNCKQGCLKLQYKYKIKELHIQSTPYERYLSSIGFFVPDPEVTVLRHVPVYGSGDVFSHIGGLLGCWLGVSVFTFTDIMEKFFRKVVRWKRRSKKRRFTLRRFRKRIFTLRRFRKRRE